MATIGKIPTLPAKTKAPNASAMLRAIHKANPNSMNQRFNPNQLQSAYGKLTAKPAAPVAATPAATTPAPTDTGATTAPPPTTTPASTTPASPTTDPTAAAKALFPGVEAFLPQNYEGSPLYQFQKKQGLGDLQALLAARGLTNSGAEIEANTKFLNQLGANEADRAQGIATNNADRLQQMSQFETNRQDTQGQAQMDNLYRFTQLMLGQSPMTQAYDATGKSADTTVAGANSQAKLMSDLYTRLFGGGGASAGPAPTYTPPYPSAPNMSIPNIMGIVNGGTSSGNSIGDIGSIVQAGIKYLPALLGG